MTSKTRFTNLFTSKIEKGVSKIDITHPLKNTKIDSINPFPKKGVSKTENSKIFPLELFRGPSAFLKKRVKLILERAELNSKKVSK